MNKQARVAMFEKVDVYPVTCEELSGGRKNLEVLESVIQGGARIIQLREKSCSVREFYHLAVKFREITRRANVLFMINDHLDIALAVGADGIHLGQEDLPLEAARKLAPDLLIGASTQSLETALSAQKAGADYINIGPIFPTRTKKNISHFLGPEMIAHIAPRIQVPFTVMGGINLSNLDQVLSCGARRIAMVTGITQAPDIRERVRTIRKRIIKAHPEDR
ncbi:MAG: thiamine phosphate synthase [Desulfobacterales bacterium]|nr:thiamine phosphate synthase [Desulfobacterales bacterium]